MRDIQVKTGFLRTKASGRNLQQILKGNDQKLYWMLVRFRTRLLPIHLAAAKSSNKIWHFGRTLIQPSLDEHSPRPSQPSTHPPTHPSTHPCTQPSSHPPTHPSMHSTIHPPIHPEIQPPLPMHTLTHPSIHPCTNSSIHPSMHSAIHPTTHPLIHPLIHPSTYPSIHTSTHSSIHPATHPPAHPSNHPLIHQSIQRSIYSLQGILGEERSSGNSQQTEIPPYHKRQNTPSSLSLRSLGLDRDQSS